MEKKNETKEKEKQKDVIADIQTLTDQCVKDMLNCKPESVKKEIFYMKLNQAKLGMVYIRDREIMKRINSGQMIRVIQFISSDAKERENYIKASIPELSPQIER